jgi:hypothetical protein
LTWSANEGGYQRQKTFYQAFDIASGQVIGTGQWIRAPPNFYTIFWHIFVNLLNFQSQHWPHSRFP